MGLSLPSPRGKADVAAVVGWRVPLAVPPSPSPTFLFVQCKLEQQACLSSKQLTVRCDGPCPCPTEQAATSSTDGKPGNECWATARLGLGAAHCQGPGAPPSGLWDGRRGLQWAGRSSKDRDRPEGPVGLEVCFTRSRRAPASSQGDCAVCF